MTRKVSALLFLWLAMSSQSYGQRGRGPETVSTDLTGYWVSLVTEDWRWRMVTPAKGDYTSVPLNPAGRRIADAWDPAKDKATGEECKAYGAPAIMRVPGRLHITQPDATTIRIDTDAGMQTRLLHLGNPQPPAQETTWQGYSVAQWESGNAPRGTGGRGAAVASGSLKVSTTGIRPGYLRKNGIPYSANAALTEYFTAFTEPDGNVYMVVMSIVSDAQYLTQPFITSTHFRKEPDNAGWNPQPCSSQ
jgi:hypothetical protein